MSENLEFDLLVKELEHADKQISAYMDLQMKILGFVFTVLAAATGLLLSTKVGERLDSRGLAQLLILVSAVGSFGVLQSSVNYGIALGYIYNKECYLAPRFQKLLMLPEKPLYAVRAFRASPARPPVMFSTLVVAIGIDVLNVALLRRVFMTRDLGGVTKGLAIAAAILVGLVAVTQVWIGLAMKKTGVASPSAGAV